MKRLIPCHNRLYYMKIKSDKVQNMLLKRTIEKKLFQVPSTLRCILQTRFLSPLKKYTYFDIDIIWVQNNSTIKRFNYMINIYLQGKISDNVYLITADFMALYTVLMTSAINDNNLQKPMICQLTKSLPILSKKNKLNANPDIMVPHDIL